MNLSKIVKQMSGRICVSFNDEYWIEFPDLQVARQFLFAQFVQLPLTVFLKWFMVESQRMTGFVLAGLKCLGVDNGGWHDIPPQKHD